MKKRMMVSLAAILIIAAIALLIIFRGCSQKENETGDNQSSAQLDTLEINSDETPANSDRNKKTDPSSPESTGFSETEESISLDYVEDYTVQVEDDDVIEFK